MDALIDKMKIPPTLIGELNETDIIKSTDSDLRNYLERDGYLFLPNIIQPNEIETARNDVFKRLREVNELIDPYQNGVSSGTSNRDKMHDDRGSFWESVCSSKSLRHVTNGKRLENTFSKIFGSPSIGTDFIFLRPVAGGKFTPMHCDSGFFTRETKQILTCWLAFTEIPLDRGPLYIIEGSHTFKDIQNKFVDFDVDIHRDKKASIDAHPVQFAEERNSRLLTADFKPGDALIFGMYTVHGTFENHAIDNKIRLTCDIRYQPKSEPKDPRYFGPKPGGTTGAGYGELNGARPLNEDWHTR